MPEVTVKDNGEKPEKKAFIPSRQRTFTIPDLEKLPNLGNATLESLIDEGGVLKDLEKAVKNIVKFYSEAIKARMVGSPQGEYYKAELRAQNRETVDMQKLKEEYPEVYQACLKDSTVYALYIKKL
jgi:hypothetical protein